MKPNEIQELQKLQKAIEFEQNNIDNLKDELEASQKKFKELQNSFYELIDKNLIAID